MLGCRSNRTLLGMLFDTFLAIAVPWVVTGKARAIPNEGAGSGDGEFSEWPFPCNALSACEPFEPEPALSVLDRSADGRGERTRDVPPYGPVYPASSDSGKARHRLFAAHPDPADLGQSGQRGDLRWLRGDRHSRPDAHGGDARRVGVRRPVPRRVFCPLGCRASGAPARAERPRRAPHRCRRLNARCPRSASTWCVPPARASGPRPSVTSWPSAGSSR